MDTLRLMLLSLLIGATVSTSPTGTTDGLAANQVLNLAQQSPTQQESVVQVAAAAAKVVYVTPSPTKVVSYSASSGSVNRSTSISTGTSIKRELYRGCQGDDVRMLQKLLKDLGYSVSVDGYYGTQTRNAVIAFQRNNGLKADGIAGSRTIRRLASSSAIPASGSSNRTTLSYGMRGQDVLELQYRLKELGYYFDISSGNYLTNTRAAVRWFQQVNGLPVDGIAGPMTLARVYSSSAIPATEYPPVGPTATAGAFYRSLYQGMSGTDVTYLQQLLKDLGYFTGNTTGYFGSATYWAVSTFQAYNGLYSDGIAGNATQQKLLSGNAIRYPGSGVPTPTVAPTSGVTPKPSTPPGSTCPYCGQYVTDANYSVHNTLAACGIHMTCVAGDHYDMMACGHYECQLNDGRSHVKMACGHYECKGSHKLDCGMHYSCQISDDASRHKLAACGQSGHYGCSGTHEQYLCGDWVCMDSNTPYHMKCSYCGKWNCGWPREACSGNTDGSKPSTNTWGGDPIANDGGHNFTVNNGKR